MEHVSNHGSPKFVRACSLPLTGQAVVDMLITDLGVFERTTAGGAFRLIELAPGVSMDEVRAKTEAKFDY
jgi:3-oxoacid CoA-transferase subunit B